MSASERQKKFRESHDRVFVWLDKGVMDRIIALGYTGNAFVKEATMKMLEEMENCK